MLIKYINFTIIILLLYYIFLIYFIIGKTVAILQNETSELMGVEKALKLQDDSGIFGEMLEIKNGCVCCSVRSDFVAAIDNVSINIIMIL